MKLLGIFAGAVLCFSPVSNAADLGPGPRKAPREPDSFVQYGGTYNWAGIYAGAFIGGVHSDWTIDFFRNNNHGHAEETSSGLAGGGWVGYNWQINPNWVLGVEGDLGGTNASQSFEVFDNDMIHTKIGVFGSVRGRVGYAVDRVLFFATGGVAWAQIDQDIQKGRNAGEQVVSEGQTHTGYIVGAGIDYAFDSHWLGRVEYLFANYGQDTIYNRDGNRAVFENDMHLLRVGLSYRF